MLSRTPWPWSVRFSPPPLVDDQTLARIHRAANNPLVPALQAEREVQHVLLGDRESAFAGRGYEFADNRPYQHGDEARFINWRVLARSGQLYRKSFYEERRPPVYLLLDRRATMRFGTRTRLKVAQATQLALFHLFVAQGRTLPVAAALLDDTPQWYAPSHHRLGLQSLIQQLCAPCPPLPEQAGVGDLRNVLQQCAVRLAPGCIVIIYSDFHELEADDLSLLHALATQHSVFARQVLDPSECEMPARGEYDFVRGDQRASLDCNDASLAARYRVLMQQRHAEIADYLRRAGIEHQVYRADDELFAAEGD